MSDFLAPFCFFSSCRLYIGMAYARRSNLVSWGHSPYESESVHDQWYEDGTERWSSEYSCYFLPCLNHYRRSCGHSLVVDWTPRRCYVLEVKSFLELTDEWQLFWGWWLRRGETQPGHMDWVRDFDFMLDQFSLPSPWNYCLFLRRISYSSLWSHRRNGPLVNSRERQSLPASTIPQIFGHWTCSALKCVKCTKYVSVQCWIRACESIVYVVCVPGWFIK